MSQICVMKNSLHQYCTCHWIDTQGFHEKFAQIFNKSGAAIHGLNAWWQCYVTSPYDFIWHTKLYQRVHFSSIGQNRQHWARDTHQHHIITNLCKVIIQSCSHFKKHLNKPTDDIIKLLRDSHIYLISNFFTYLTIIYAVLPNLNCESCERKCKQFVLISLVMVPK